MQLRDEAQQDRTKDARNCLQNLRHRFLVCLGYRPVGDGEPVYLSEPVVVEPRFREQFAIAHPTPAYEATLQVRLLQHCALQAAKARQGCGALDSFAAGLL